MLAGQTGEAVLQPIIAGLPRFLRRGGAFYAMCAGWDAKDGSFEAKPDLLRERLALYPEFVSRDAFLSLRVRRKLDQVANPDGYAM